MVKLSKSALMRNSARIFRQKAETATTFVERRSLLLSEKAALRLAYKTEALECSVNVSEQTLFQKICETSEHCVLRRESNTRPKLTNQLDDTHQVLQWFDQDVHAQTLLSSLVRQKRQSNEYTVSVSEADNLVEACPLVHRVVAIKPVVDQLNAYLADS